MAHIISAKVDGLAGRKTAVEMLFDPKLNVLYGENGSGKTSLLKLLHGALQNDVSGLTLTSFLKAQITFHSVKYNCDVVRVLENTASRRLVEQDTLFSEQRFQHFRRLRAREMQWQTKASDSERPETRFAHQYLPVSRLYVRDPDDPYFYGAWPVDSQGSPANSNLLEEKLEVVFAHKIRTLWSNYASSILQEVQQAQQLGIASILKRLLSSSRHTQKHETAGDSSLAYATINSFLKRQPGFSRILGSEQEFSQLYTANADLRGIIRDIEVIENKIEQALRPQEEFRQLVNSLFSNGKQVNLKRREIDVTDRAGDSIEMEALSSGEKHLLQLYVQTLLAGDGSIIIDEPEISLHIDWQRSLIKNLKTLNPHAQIIVATHSPEVMADVEDQFVRKV